MQTITIHALEKQYRNREVNNYIFIIPGMPVLRHFWVSYNIVK